MSNAEIEDLRALLEEVIRLRRSIKHAETRSGGRIDAVRPRHRESALNLVHYTELRRHDIRTITGPDTAGSASRNRSNMPGTKRRYFSDDQFCSTYGSPPPSRPARLRACRHRFPPPRPSFPGRAPRLR